MHYFGEIKEEVITLTEIGKYLVEELEEASQHHPYIEVIQYVVMPNHFHAIVEVSENNNTDVAGHVRKKAKCLVRIRG